MFFFIIFMMNSLEIGRSGAKYGLDYFCIFLIILTMIIRGVNRTMNARNRFMNPWIATLFPLMRLSYPYSATFLEVGSFFVNILFLVARASFWNPLSVGPGQSVVTVTHISLHSSAIPSEKAST